MIHTLAKYYVQHNGYKVKHIRVILSGTWGTDKSHLVKVIYNAISRTLLYHCKDTERPRHLSFGPAGISAVNIGETNISSDLGIKPGSKLLGLND